MKAVLVARDIAPSGAFERLIPELEKNGFYVDSFLGKGKPLSEKRHEIETAIAVPGVNGVAHPVADVVVVGMSSSKELAEPEIAACETAIQANIPYGFYGDTYGCHERAREGAWFGPFRERASFFFAINEEEANKAMKTFPSADSVIATGNPLWEDFAFPKFSREEVRANLGLEPDEKFILSPGGKSPVVNILVWGNLIEAARILAAGGRKIKLIFAPHPGDRAIYALSVDQNPLGIYDDLVKFSPVPVQFTDKSVKTSELVPGADLVVEWGSTIGIEAAHLRIPVVSFATEIGKKRLMSTSGSEKLEPVELGVSLGVSSREVLVNMLGQLLSGGPSAESLRKRQEQVYPAPPERGAAVQKMAETLFTLATLKKDAGAS